MDNQVSMAEPLVKNVGGGMRLVKNVGGGDGVP
jgi:hypothetical protein